MFLKKIKLAGFKSFVDPTTLNFPGQLSAVVGPNGSGKSNVIDAVTWVMGENSMKYLRGETSTDVIFNGSTARKPVGQASIELIFDNQSGTIGGEYSQYAEISIKRTLTRDSDSTYYLNNSACRRRDIVDIFSGTGLGPRSYSIIGQNMVSRIVDSKPDDMRAYLEEAAGISKYKDRRRETELRIQHTKDNLARVNDLRTELDRQLTQLKRQASDAEKYKTLKEQERLTKSQWYTIQWQQLDSQLVQYTLNIKQEETAQEAYQAEIVSSETALEERRQEQRGANDAFQEVQRRYYSMGNEIARIEQDLVHQQERQQQLENDLRQVIVNLINNAVDAMDGEGKIEIQLRQIPATEVQGLKFSTLKQDNYCRIDVKDTGHGMDQSTMDRIFEPFFTTKEVGKGTGLGLSTVHSIVKEHLGEILVSSQMGKGSVFTIYFPEREFIQEEHNHG